MRLEEVRARLRTASELEGIVRTLRALSETRLLQGKRAFGHFRRYADEVRRALERGRRLVPGGPLVAAPGGVRALLVLGSEHGFVGALDEKVVAAALEAVKAGPRPAVLLAGSRLVRAAREGGLAGEAELRLATTVSGLERTARALTDLVATRLARGELASLVVIGPRRRGERDWEVASEPVCPIPAPAEPAHAPAREPLLHYLPVTALVPRLVEEFVFSRIAGAVAEAFLAEQIARVRAMEATRRSLDEKLDALRRDERLVRQAVITSELLDVVAGAEALTSPRAPGGGA